MNATKILKSRAYRSKEPKIRKKPKLNVSAYHIFSKEVTSCNYRKWKSLLIKMHESLNESGDKTNSAKRTALISEKWSALSAEEKDIYMEKAKLDRQRYLNELDHYYKSVLSNAEVAPITNKPKRFMSSFVFYVREKMNTIRQSQMRLSTSDIITAAAQEWRLMSDAEKRKYIDASKEDKKRYKRELRDSGKSSSTNNPTPFLKPIEEPDKITDKIKAESCENQKREAVDERLNFERDIAKKTRCPNFEYLMTLSRAQESFLPSFIVCVQNLDNIKF